MKAVNVCSRFSHQETIFGCDVDRYLLCENSIAPGSQLMSPDNICGQCPIEPTTKPSLVCLVQIVATGQKGQTCLCFCGLLKDQVRQAAAGVYGNDKVGCLQGNFFQ